MALDAKTGDEVWRVQTGSGIRSHPIAYELDGTVYLAVGSGGGGVELFESVCGGYCHAIEEGESTDAPDLFDCEWWHGDTDADLFRVIRDGVPTTRMQSFGGQFPDDDLWRLIAAIRAGSRCKEDGRQPAGDGR